MVSNKRIFWRVVKRTEVPKDENIMGGHFILMLKNHGAPKEKAKVPYVAQVYIGCDQLEIVQDTANIRPSSTRLILSIATLDCFQLFSHDITQAHLQSKNKLTRRIYFHVKNEDPGTFAVREDELLELIKPLRNIQCWRPLGCDMWLMIWA